MSTNNDKEMILRRIKVRIYILLIWIRKIFTRRQNNISDNSIEELLGKYKNKSGIVVLGSGPSAGNVSLHKNSLYLVTNTGSKIVQKYDYLYYLLDDFYLRQNLSNSIRHKDNQEVLFYFEKTLIGNKKNKYLLKNIFLFKKYKLYLLNDRGGKQNEIKNLELFENFYKERKLEINICNSGVFLLLFGYFLAYKLKLPIEIYGLDMGEGGKLHFDGAGGVTGTITRQRTKNIVKEYLEFMYSEYRDIKNYSYFLTKEK